VALWAYAEEFGYSSGVWGTYRQWAEAGAQVRQGEKAAFVVFYKELAFATDPETGDTETAARLFARATPVFAAEQVDGFTPSTIGAPPVTTTPIEQAEAFVAATGASIHHGGGRAYYRPSTDSIHLPSRDAFIGTKTSTPAESQELHRRRRKSVRSSLFVGAMVAARYNPQLKSFRDKLVAAGKPKLIALVAVPRKLITILNAILRDRRRWQPIPA
jgi:antirestriction protein ArdC